MQSFTIFKQFPNLKIGIFDKTDGCTSDAECGGILGFDDTVKLNQVHGNFIHVIDEVPDPSTRESPARSAGQRGDGIITNTPNLAISVRWADCQGFIIYAPKKKVLGALHAGWRGLACNAITAFYEKLKEEFSINPEDTYVGISPSLCKKCAVYDDALNIFPPHMHPFIDGNLIDLMACADSELASLNLPKDHIERHPDFTCCMQSKYWTNRGGDREAVQAGTGRNYLVVGIMR